jgi:hypothetical protein
LDVLQTCFFDSQYVYFHVFNKNILQNSDLFRFFD